MAKRKQSFREWFIGPPAAYVLVGVILAGGFGGAQLLHSCQARRASEARAQRVVFAHLVRHADGREAVLLIHHAEGGRRVGGRWWRLDLVDPATGRRTARETLKEGRWGSALTCQGASPGRLWCHVRTQGLSLRDTRTLRVVVSPGQLLSRMAGLSIELHGVPRVEERTGRLLVTNRRGEELLLDPATLKAAPFSSRTGVLAIYGGDALLWDTVQSLLPAPFPPDAISQGASDRTLHSDQHRRLSPAQQAALRSAPRLRRLGMSQEGTVGAVELPEGSLELASAGGSPRRSLILRRGQDQEAVAPGTTFLNPAFLRDDRTGAALRLPDGDDLLVTHQDQLDDRSARLVSRVTRAGAVRWTSRHRPGRYLKTFRFGEQVVIVVDGAAERTHHAFALDGRDGTVRWTYPF
jgi:hypothetical protein